MSNLEEAFKEVFKEEIAYMVNSRSYGIDEETPEEQEQAVSIVYEDFLKDLKTLIELSQPAINAKKNEDSRGW